MNSNNPEQILEQVEIYLSDKNVPNYVAVQALEKGIKANPQSTQLKDKLIEIQENKKQNLSEPSPKTLYIVLVVLISLIGLLALFSWAVDSSNTYGLLIGISFLVVSAVIFRQYKKEK